MGEDGQIRVGAEPVGDLLPILSGQIGPVLNDVEGQVDELDVLDLQEVAVALVEDDRGDDGDALVPIGECVALDDPGEQRRGLLMGVGKTVGCTDRPARRMIAITPLGLAPKDTSRGRSSTLAGVTDNRMAGPGEWETAGQRAANEGDHSEAQVWAILALASAVNRLAEEYKEAHLMRH